MKRILIIILVLALLGGLAAGASIYLQVGPLAGVMKPKEPPKEPPPPPPPRHVEIPMGSFIIPIIQEHGINHSLGFDIVLDVLDEDKPKVETQTPRFQNAFLLALYEIVPVHPDSHSAADKKAIHDRLMAACLRIIGKGLVQDVVIKSIYER